VSEAPDTLLSARDLRVGYGGAAILPPVDVELREGEAWALLGHNGAGKTTLMRTLIGLLPPVAGELTRSASCVGYVPQRSELDLSVPSRVLDIVRTGLDGGWSFFKPLMGASMHKAVDRALRDARVVELAREPFAALSEGQKQRVLFARALASEPRLLVLDEPTSAMDRSNEDKVFALIEELRDTRNLAVLVITHDIERALSFCDHVVHVDKDNGFARAGDVAEIVRAPEFISQFGAFFEVTSAETGDD
jgi:ABC-type Mn2+/Zn2+ transport system ATPase subunit